MKNKMNRIIKFACVGCLGFLVDILCFHIFYYVFHVEIMTARLIAFAFAVNTTWLGNRLITFKSYQNQNTKERFGEWIKFIITASISLLPNLIIFQGIMMLGNTTDNLVLFALIMGIGAGATSNYLFSAKWVFANGS